MKQQELADAIGINMQRDVYKRQAYTNAGLPYGPMQKNGIRKSNPDAAKKSYLITKQCEIE